MSSSSHLRLLFETHATSLDNEAGLASGSFDIELSAAGEEQARTLGVRHQHDELAAVCWSDLQRAFRTAGIAFAHRALLIVRDARRRECDYGRLTRRRLREIEAQRAEHVAIPFPKGESYQQVTCRVAAWLDEAVKAYGGRTILAIGHRATFYAFEHLIKGVSLHEAVMSAWRWQPGWMYELTPGLNHASRQRSKVVTN